MAALCGLAVSMITTCLACASSTTAENVTARSIPEVAAAHLGSPSTAELRFGQEFRFSDNLVIYVSQPRIFKPSDTAYPQSDRAVAYDVTIKNDRAQPYRLSSLTISAQFNNASAKQLVDPVQGFNGITNADSDVMSRQQIKVSLAFAVPVESVDFQLGLQPHPPQVSGEIAVYRGTV